jgi:peptidoglycan-associated lipoprotein
MRSKMIKIICLMALSGFAPFTLGGCAQKTVKLDQIEETARVEDTVSAQASAKQGDGQAAVDAAKTGTSSGSEGAGMAESLDSPAPGQGGMAGMSGGDGAAGVVAGSRTDLGLMPVYFDFDKSLIRQDQVERVEANALFLKNNPEIMVRIEGNCDNRGTNEYNMALGERRAMGVVKYLINLGVAEGRLATLSYGEERPVNSGNDELAWSENRRGDLVIVR